MLMIIIVFFRKHESNSWIFLFILKKDSSNSMCTMANDVVSTTWLTNVSLLGQVIRYWWWPCVIEFVGWLLMPEDWAVHFLTCPLIPCPLCACLCVNQRSLNYRKSKEGSIFMSRWIRRDLLCCHTRYGQSWRLLWLNKKGISGKSTELKDFVHLIKSGKKLIIASST